MRSSFTQIRRAFHSRKDGSFEFTDAPIGVVAVSAATATLPFSQAVHIRVPNPDPVILEFAAPLLGRGHVVDIETGQPVTSALVQAVAMLPEGTLSTWGQEQQVDAEGRFNFAGFVPGQNAARILADGYAEREARAFSLGDRVDFGRIALERPRALSIRLEANAPFDFTRVSARGAEDTPLPKREFDASGFVRFENAEPGLRFVELEGSPQAAWIFLRLDLEQGKAWNFSHRLTGERRLVVDVAGSSDDVPAIVGISVAYQSSGGVHTEMGLPLRLEGTFTVEGIDAESACVSVMGPVKVKAAALAELRGNELYAKLDLGEAPFLLRVVDPKGAAIQGVLVRLIDSQASALYLVGTTGEEGSCLFTGVPRRRVLVSLEHESHGRLLGAALDGTIREAELVLGDDAEIRLVVVDGENPISGVQARALIASIGSRWSVLGHSDDGGQLVADNLGEGAYVVALDHPDCWPVTLEAKASSTPSPQRVQIRRRGALSFALRSPEGSAHAGKTLELHSLEFDADVTEWLGEGMVVSQTGLTSDSKGEIRIERLPRGPYRYRLATSAGDWIEGRCEVLPGALISVPVELQ